jgi:hypothetical protein
MLVTDTKYFTKFTSSVNFTADPLNRNGYDNYSPFSLYANYFHGGDTKTAVKALYQKYDISLTSGSLLRLTAQPLIVGFAL